MDDKREEYELIKRTQIAAVQVRETGARRKVQIFTTDYRIELGSRARRWLLRTAELWIRTGLQMGRGFNFRTGLQIGLVGCNLMAEYSAIEKQINIEEKVTVEQISK